MSNSAILLLSCPLAQNISFMLTQYIYEKKGKILYHQHYVDPVSHHFYSRIEWDLSTFTTHRDEILTQLETIFDGFNAIISSTVFSSLR